MTEDAAAEFRAWHCRYAGRRIPALLRLPAEANAERQRNELGVGGIAEDIVEPPLEKQGGSSGHIVEAGSCVQAEVSGGVGAEQIGIAPGALGVIDPDSTQNVWAKPALGRRRKSVGH